MCLVNDRVAPTIEIRRVNYYFKFFSFRKVFSWFKILSIAHYVHGSDSWQKITEFVVWVWSERDHKKFVGIIIITQRPHCTYDSIISPHILCVFYWIIGRGMLLRRRKGRERWFENSRESLLNRHKINLRVITYLLSFVFVSFFGSESINHWGVYEA